MKLLLMQLKATTTLLEYFYPWTPGEPLETPRASQKVPEYTFNHIMKLMLMQLWALTTFSKDCSSPTKTTVQGCQKFQLLYFSIFSKNSFARSFSTLSSTIPQSLTQIGPATCEEIGNTRFASPWNHTGAFGSVNTTYSFRIGTRNASKLAISKGKNAGLLIRCLCPPRSWSFP